MASLLRSGAATCPDKAAAGRPLVRFPSLTLQTGFALVYLGTYTEKGGLTFPGDEEPSVVDRW